MGSRTNLRGESACELLGNERAIRLPERVTPGAKREVIRLAK